MYTKPLSLHTIQNSLQATISINIVTLIHISVFALFLYVTVQYIPWQQWLCRIHSKYNAFSDFFRIIVLFQRAENVVSVLGVNLISQMGCLVTFCLKASFNMDMLTKMIYTWSFVVALWNFYLKGLICCACAFYLL